MPSRHMRGHENFFREPRRPKRFPNTLFSSVFAKHAETNGLIFWISCGLAKKISKPLLRPRGGSGRTNKAGRFCKTGLPRSQPTTTRPVRLAEGSSRHPIPRGGKCRVVVPKRPSLRRWRDRARDQPHVLSTSFSGKLREWNMSPPVFRTSFWQHWHPRAETSLVLLWRRWRPRPTAKGRFPTLSCGVCWVYKRARMSTPS